MLTKKILHFCFDIQSLEPLTICPNSLIFSYKHMHMFTRQHDCLCVFSHLIWLLSCLCHWTKSCYTLHVNCIVEGHVASIGEKCSCVSNLQKCELMYCDWSFYCKYNWELAWPSYYQRCVIHVYVEWCLHASVFNWLLCPSATNMQILWGQERCTNVVTVWRCECLPWCWRKCCEKFWVAHICT